MDKVHALTKWIDHNRYKAAAALLTLAIVVVSASCQSETASIRDPQVKLDRQAFEMETIAIEGDLAAERAQLQASIETFNLKVQQQNDLVEAGLADLDRQDQIKAKLYELAGGVITKAAAGELPSPAALAVTGLTAGSLLFGIGARADSKRKDRVIEDLKIKKAA